MKTPQLHKTIHQKGKFVRKAEGIYQYSSSGTFYALFNYKGRRIKQRLGTSATPCISLADAQRLLGELKASLSRNNLESSRNPPPVLLSGHFAATKRSVAIKAMKPFKKQKCKNLTANLSVQIPAEMDERLTTVAAKSGLSKNLIARQSLLAAIQMIERDSGLFLPLSFPKDEGS